MHLVTLWIKGILVRKKKRKEKCHRKLNICFHSNLGFSLRFVKDSETHYSLHLVWYFRLVIGGYWQTRKERQLGGLKHKHLCHWHFLRGCPGVPVHEGIPFVFITIHGVMTQFVNVFFFCVPVHEDTTLCKPNKKDKKCRNETERSKNEEQFPNDTVGQLSANCRLTLGQQLANSVFITDCR